MPQSLRCGENQRAQQTDASESEEAPWVSKVGTDKQAAQQRARDRAEATNSCGESHGGCAHLGRVILTNEGVDEYLGAEHKDAGEQNDAIQTDQWHPDSK